MAGRSSFPPGVESDPKTRTKWSPFPVNRSRAPRDTRFKCTQETVASNATLSSTRRDAHSQTENEPFFSLMGAPLRSQSIFIHGDGGAKAQAKRLLHNEESRGLALPSHQRQVNAGFRPSIMYGQVDSSYMKEVWETSGPVRIPSRPGAAGRSVPAQASRSPDARARASSYAPMLRESRRVLPSS